MLGYCLTAFAAASIGFVVAGFIAGSKVADVEQRLTRAEALVRAQADLIRRLTGTSVFIVAGDPARRDCHGAQAKEEPLA